MLDILRSNRVCEFFLVNDGVFVHNRLLLLAISHAAMAWHGFHRFAALQRVKLVTSMFDTNMCVLWTPYHSSSFLVF